MATYKAMVKRSGGPSGGAAQIHVISDGAEASLCGVPRSSLGPIGTMDDVLCQGCVDALTAANRSRPSRLKVPPEYKQPKSI